MFAVSILTCKLYAMIVCLNDSGLAPSSGRSSRQVTVFALVAFMQLYQVSLQPPMQRQYAKVCVQLADILITDIIFLSFISRQHIQPFDFIDVVLFWEDFLYHLCQLPSLWHLGVTETVGTLSVLRLVTTQPAETAANRRLSSFILTLGSALLL